MPSNSLEQEAMDRVRRMYASFDRREPPPKPVEAPKQHEHDEHQKQHEHDHREPNDRHEPHHERHEPPAMPAKGLIELLMQDKDQSLLLLLLVILMKDGADMDLLLALIYILL